MARTSTSPDPAEPADAPAPADLLGDIRTALPSLAPAERRVAEAVLGDPAQAARLSISALAARARTSVTTVMRFCRTVGLTNYPQLRLALAGAAAREHALRGDRPVISTDISATDSLEQVVEKIVYNETRSLEDTGAGLDVTTLRRAVDAVAEARRIDIFGMGASGFVGQDLHQKLHRIGLMAFIWTDVHAALTAAALLGSADVAIGISHSGATADTVEPLQVAAGRGATTIALTNFARSPIAECADLLLTTSAHETPYRSGATASRIAQLAVVDCLFVGVAQRSYDHATEAINGTWGAIHGRGTRRLPSAPSAGA
ncbi:MurR/RpiR family transcriptional regulator [Streptomyces thermodiastaticus]|jgi:DNA-binding MurR/RpiR family transcriptional regulator|uniref:MurR/RpiR family transcriptional regulator n=1 Tax=Streptomyces thermodiastaticus TaxID=44061 RepID=UPI0016758EBE|nr:MurR/RpiR family transcriptional regulator [Streptomyces thermodiastaticus]MCE7553484.1 MurR/RpiR family transcriptional regulator [Streptomyces thermodiastaticus]GHF79900.1 transcriptional regulator [Streptomyces thermodiastaticus]